MGDFNQIGIAIKDPMRRQAFQDFMMTPGLAAGAGLSGAGRDQTFQDYLNKRMQESIDRRRIDAMKANEEQLRFNILNNRDSRRDQLSEDIQTLGGAIPGTMIGNMQGVLRGSSQPQATTRFGPVTPGAFAGNELYQLLVPRR